MKKPVPEDFGLTPEEYEKAIKEGFPTLADFPREELSEEDKYIIFFSGIRGAVIGGIVGWLIGWLLENEVSFALGFAILISLMVGFYIGGSKYDSIMAKLNYDRRERYRQAEELSKPLREKVQNYEKAQREYQRRREEYWESLRGVEFEESLADLYEDLGYAVETTKGSGDEGVDLFLQKDEKVIVVQCKGHGKPIGVGAIRDLYGAMIHFKADSAILACPAGFTIGVEKFATDKAIQLISATDLVEIVESVGNR